MNECDLLIAMTDEKLRPLGFERLLPTACPCWRIKDFALVYIDQMLQIRVQIRTSDPIQFDVNAMRCPAWRNVETALLTMFVTHPKRAILAAAYPALNEWIHGIDHHADIWEIHASTPESPRSPR